MAGLLATAHEIRVLTGAPVDAVASIAGERVAEVFARSRAGDVAISPGYDGVYGTVRLWETERIMGEPSEGAPA